MSLLDTAAIDRVAMKRKSSPIRRPNKPALGAAQLASVPPASVPFPIVGIGASAGGLEALELF
jgi:chemotaxis response regulator CheB